ncbi:MAG: histidinol-phosphatase HisJ family protein [Armatimonadetes bacterium]|nr:histidinol-phosphatase HisJ family protein [Candidatus Hippobium faecium]
MFADYHVHTTLSGDSTQTIDSICADALKLGIKEICLTEHQDFLPGDFYYNRYSFEKVSQMAEYAEKEYPGIIVKKGVEIDYQTQFLPEIFDFCMSYDFDYIIGSVHKINNKVVEGAEYYGNRSEDEIYTEYFRKIREMICTNMFNCVGHIDFIKRGATPFFGRFDAEKYKDVICDALKEIIKRDMCLEINTNGFHRPALNDFYPDVKILKWYKELGGENINFGSDSHEIHHLGTKINEMYDLIEKLGFDKITTYSERIKKYVPV